MGEWERGRGALGDEVVADRPEMAMGLCWVAEADGERMCDGRGREAIVADAVAAR